MIRERIREKPLVSIIVPVYNTQEYLARCVDSILAQTYELIEVVLVDDGSTDDSGRICDAYAEKDNRVEVLHKSNGGLMSAWMAGVGISRGEYLSFVDSDDWIDREMIETLTEYRDGSNEIICCNHVIEYTSGRQKKELHGAAPGSYTKETLYRDIFCKILGHRPRTVTMSRCMKLIARDLILKNMHYCDPSITMGEDVNIMLPAILDSERVVILQDAFYYHYLYKDDSMVHRYDAGLTESMHRLNRLIRTILTDKLTGKKRTGPNLTEREIEAIAERERLFLCMLQIKNELRDPDGNVTERIRALCHAEHTQKTARKYPLAVADKADRLIYAVEQNPTNLRIRFLKTLFVWYHKRGF